MRFRLGKLFPDTFSPATTPLTANTVFSSVSLAPLLPVKEPTTTATNELWKQPSLFEPRKSPPEGWRRFLDVLKIRRHAR